MCEVHLKVDLFVRSMVVHFSDSTTVFVQGPLVKHLALSKECFFSFKVLFSFVRHESVERQRAGDEGQARKVFCAPLFFSSSPLPLR